MEEIKIQTGSQLSRIILDGKLRDMGQYVPKNTRLVIITDANLLKHYSDVINQYNTIVIGTGEENKNLSTLDYIMGKLVEFEADRSSYIVGIGGGIVCDVTGFAASVYMRGIRFGFVSTTVLSMVDASVGGKNGVNYKGFKNMVGVFNQPDFVLCDFDMLKTLDRQEYIDGYGEIIKHGAIKDYVLFEYLEQNADKALQYNKDVIHRVIGDSVRIKSKVVEADERESGERRKLNFGHTFGHAVEKLTKMSHGKAISIGMVMAADASVALKMLSEQDARRLKNLIAAYQLPVDISIDKQQLLQAMKKDKKREGAGVHLVLLEKLGNAVVKNVPYNQLEEIVHDMRLR